MVELPDMKTQTKICSKCGIEKPFAMFSKRTNTKCGLRSECKECVKLYNIATKEQIANRCHKYYCEHTEEKLQYDRNYRATKLDKVKDSNRRKIRRAENKDTVAEQNKLYREIRDSKIIAYKREYNKSHSKENLDWLRKYRHTPTGSIVHLKYNHRRRQREKLSDSTLTARQWNKILSLQEWRCAECGSIFSIDLVPTKDHIIPVSKWGGLTYGNIQALCKSCNCKKNATTHFMRAISELITEV